MRRAPHRLLAGALACVAVLATGCTVGPSSRPPVAVRGQSAPAAPSPTVAAPPADALPAPTPARPRIPFRNCTGTILRNLTPPPARPLQIDCSELDAPADQDQPSRGRVSLDVFRVGEPGGVRDRPPLVLIGDTAGEASALAAVRMAERVQPALLQQYALVGMDRRGTGADELDCAPLDARSALLDGAIDVADDAELSALLEQARRVVQACTVLMEGGIGVFRSATSAADLERLRVALGIDRLNVIGVGDGAAAVARWARLNPSAVGRVILDSPPHPTLDEPELTESRAAAAETAFNAFAIACDAQQACQLGSDPRATVSGLLAQLRQRPLDDDASGGRLTVGRAVAALTTGLAEPDGWPVLADALAAAHAGNPAPLLRLLEPVTGSNGRFDTMLATSCNDTRHRLTPDAIRDLAVRWRENYPLFGASAAMHLLACAPWPTGGPPPPDGPGAGLPPILVIGAAADPLHPADGARSTADSLGASRYLNWLGAGTGAYPRTPCVRDNVDSVLLSGTVPPPSVFCPP